MNMSAAVKAGTIGVVGVGVAVSILALRNRGKQDGARPVVRERTASNTVVETPSNDATPAIAVQGRASADEVCAPCVAIGLTNHRPTN